MSFVLLAFLTFLVFYFKRWWFSDFKRKFHRIPGPPGLPFIGNSLEFTTRFHLYQLGPILSKWAKEYGPIFKTQSCNDYRVHLSSPEYIEEVLKSTTLLTKGYNNQFLVDWLGNSLLTSTGDQWHARRRLLTPSFHFQILNSYLDVFNEQSHVLIDQFERRLKGGSDIDVYPLLTRCIPLISYAILRRRCQLPWLSYSCIFRRSTLGKEFNECLHILQSFTKQVIADRKLKLQLQQEKDDCIFQKQENKKKAFLDLLLEASNQGRLLNDITIQEEVDTFMFAGHDTNSSALTWFLYLIAEHPEEQEKVYHELAKVFEGSQRPCTSNDIPCLKYLDCCIKETLRLMPSVPIILRKATHEVQLGEYTVPAGCSISILIHAVHRNPSYFPDPESYKPERFLPENFKGRHPYAYIPFSAGPRNCIGQKFALLEQKVIVANLLRRFRFELSPKTEFEPRLQIILKPRDQLILGVYPRH